MTLHVARLSVFALIPVLCVELGICATPNGDKCDDAKDAAQKYLDLYEDIRRMIPEEQSRFVDAVCHADEDARADPPQRGRSEGRKHSLFSSSVLLRKLGDDADKALQSAIESDECKEKADDLIALQKRCQEISKRIDRMSNGVRAGNNPVFSALRDLGQKAHMAYQSMGSTLDNANSKDGDAEVRLDDISRQVDFLDPDGCQVVELKPDANSDPQNDGMEDAKKARDWLNDPTNLATFVQDHPKYAHCTKFVARVDCYHFCPVVLEDGSLQVGNMDWKTCKGPE
jgi:hypothetical protein